MNQDFFDYYNKGGEHNRNERCDIEFTRSKEILSRYFRAGKSTILDMGGGAGYYSFWLQEQGHDVHLRDIVSLHIEQARKKAHQSGLTLSSIEVGDATHIEFDDNTFDRILLFGPLYHIQDKNIRRKVLEEAKRVLKDDGIIFAVCIPRTSSYCDMFSKDQTDDKLFLENVNSVLLDGNHNDKRELRFTNAYFHKPHEFVEEIKEAGLLPKKLINIEGIFKMINDFDEKIQNADFYEFYLKMTKEIETDMSLMGTASHIMAIIRK